MSVSYGNCRLIFDVVRFYLGTVLFLYITLPLMAVWVLVGVVLDPPATLVPGISVHVYINIMIMAVGGFRTLFPIAIGMGSTRVQFLKSHYLTGIAAVFTTILLLNVCQYLLMVAYDRLVGFSNILHPAVLFVDGYHFLSYFAIDLAVGIFLFGTTFFAYCVWYRLGTAHSAIALMALALPILFLYYGGTLDACFSWLGQLASNPTALFAFVGSLGLTTLWITYPLMRNAPLQPKPAKG